jgi:hypothetical protein
MKTSSDHPPKTNRLYTPPPSATKHQIQIAAFATISASIETVSAMKSEEFEMK